MTLPIQTYNQGFFKFGPLEKCDNGTLMKAEDVYAYTRSLERTLQDGRQEDVAILTDLYQKACAIAEKKDGELEDLRKELRGLECNLDTASNIVDESHERIDYWSDLYFKSIETSVMCVGIAASTVAVNLILIALLWLS